MDKKIPMTESYNNIVHLLEVNDKDKNSDTESDTESDTKIDELSFNCSLSQRKSLSLKDSRRSNKLQELISVASSSPTYNKKDVSITCSSITLSRSSFQEEFTDKNFQHIMDCIFSEEKDYLDLSGFNLNIFPQKIKDAIYDNFFVHVSCLDLSFCNIYEIDESLFSLLNLRELHLGNNNLLEIPENISNFTRLEIFDVNSNKLKDLPKSIKKLCGLKSANISANNFNLIPICFFSITKLENLYISGNPRIEDLPPYEYLEGMQKLYIEIDNNPNFVEKWNILKLHMEINYIFIKWNQTFPSKINNNLYLCGITAVQYKQVYEILDIGAIFTIGQNLKPIILDNIAHYILPIEDHESTQFDFSIIDTIHEFISKNIKCIVHCQMGVSRSVSIVMAYLMKYENKSYYDSLHYVKKCRKCASPNPGFVKQLIEFEKTVNMHKLK
jgi:protein-tyrosine phosphatase